MWRKITNYFLPVTFERYIEAIKTGDLATVDKYIAANPKINDNWHPTEYEKQTARQEDAALTIAARDHNHQMVEKLQKFFSSSIPYINNPATALMTAAIDGCETCVAMLAKFNHWSGDDQADKNGYSALMHAIVNDNQRAALRLLEPDARATINRVNEDGDSILMLAIRHRLTPVILQLKKMGVDTSIRNKAGETALSLVEKDKTLRDIYPIDSKEFIDACKHGQLAYVERYIAAHKKHPDHINQPNFRDGRRTALTIAADHGHLPIVQALLEVAGININYYDVFGTALVHAAMQGHEEIAQTLLQAPGIDINAKNKKRLGSSAIVHAASRGHINIVKALLAKPKINLDDVASALLEALHYEKYDCFKVLLAHPGLDVHKLNQNGLEYPIFIKAASSNEDDRFFKDLLTVPGMNINVKDEDGYNALMLVCDGNRTDRAKILLARPEIEINAAGPSGKTALMNATHRDEEMTGKLIEAKADINHVAKSGASALMLALDEKEYEETTSLKTAQQLLKAGADTTIIDENNQTAVSLCVRLKKAHDSPALSLFLDELRDSNATQTVERAKKAEAKSQRAQVKFFDPEPTAVPTAPATQSNLPTPTN